MGLWRVKVVEMRLLSVFGVFTAAIVLMAAPQHGQARDLRLTADPPGFWRIVTHDGKMDTSPCVGANVTPICALDTHFGCYAKTQGALCDMVMPPGSGPKKFGKYLDPGRTYTKYRISRIHKMRGDEFSFAHLDHQDGDTAVVFFYVHCSTGVDVCKVGDPPERIFIARKFDDGWRFIAEDNNRGYGNTLLHSLPARDSLRPIGDK
jgi:hypothetical protein